LIKYVIDFHPSIPEGLVPVETKFGITLILTIFDAGKTEVRDQIMSSKT
jgi:hypothetical protein